MEDKEFVKYFNFSLKNGVYFSIKAINNITSIIIKVVNGAETQGAKIYRNKEDMKEMEKDIKQAYKNIYLANNKNQKTLTNDRNKQKTSTLHLL